ncbi:MAG TPA: VanZ family protein, partial [Longimicrobiaceae bacterium]|nr:VanZ family protein [Longimicrobiaceae bacterium]
MESAAQPTGVETPPAPTRARLSRALLAYFVGVVLVITLAPFRFAVPTRFHIFSVGEPFDLAANVLLFVPLGFLYPLTRAHGRRALVLEAAALGLILSGAIETAQLFERERYASAVDLLANGAGALAGAALQHAVGRRIRVSAETVGRLSLELPLMGLVYLLVPLLWVGSLAAREQPLRLAPLLLLGLFGGALLAGMQRHRFGPAGSLGVPGVAVAAAAWMALGLFPALVFHPRLALPVLAVVALATAWEASR